MRDANTTGAMSAILSENDDLRAILEQLAAALNLPLGRVCAAFIVGFGALIAEDVEALKQARKAQALDD